MKGKGKRGKMGKRKLVEMIEYGGETGWTVGVTIWPQHMEANKDKEQGTRGCYCGEEAINSSLVSLGRELAQA